ncbi:MAG: hypothetical protein P8L49_17000 [Opitutaceae bacterium]|nr:hypothetical protein [Opitutaceae bacterium]
MDSTPSHSFPKALPALAAAVDQLNASDAALSYRIINANLRIGGIGEARRVASIATNELLGSELRIEIVSSLSNWVEPPLWDRVDCRRREHGVRDEQSIAKAVGPVLNELLASKDDNLLEVVVSAAARLNVELQSETFVALLKNQQASSPLRVLALENLNTKDAIAYALETDLVDLRVKAVGMLIGSDPDQATLILGDQLTFYSSIQQAQSALASLVLVESPQADRIIGDFARGLKANEVPAKLKLDILEAASKRGFEDVVSSFESSRDSSIPIGAFAECLEGGDVRIGEEIVNTHLGTQCIRCHRVSSASGSKIGPNLKNMGAKIDNICFARLLIQAGILRKGLA